jgi:hypothetical protein
VATPLLKSGLTAEHQLAAVALVVLLPALALGRWAMAPRLTANLT